MQLNRGTKLYSDTVLIDDELVSTLENLYNSLNCSKIVITSGYRTAQMDRDVGGNGKGKHVEGKAADIICYDSSSNIIDSRYVCVAAQDLDVGGIAYISKSATHIDTRSGSRYKGNEQVGTNTVTSDFYEYFNIERKYNVMNDSTVSDWAKDAVKQIVDAGIMKGYDNGSFGGKDALSREQFAKALVNMKNKGIINF